MTASASREGTSSGFRTVVPRDRAMASTRAWMSSPLGAQTHSVVRPGARSTARMAIARPAWRALTLFERGSQFGRYAPGAEVPLFRVKMAHAHQVEDRPRGGRQAPGEVARQRPGRGGLHGIEIGRAHV